MRPHPPHASLFRPELAPVLTPVAAEMRLGLERVNAALLSAQAPEEALLPADLASALQEARTMRAVLELLQEQGGSLLLAGLIQGLESLEAGTAPLEPALRPALQLACRSLPDYLEERLSAAPPSPLYLFPSYQALQQALGKGRATPGALFFPSPCPEEDAPEADEETPAPALASSRADGWTTAVAGRRHFERHLLPLLQDAATPRTLAALVQWLQQMHQAAADPRERTFWQVAESLGGLLQAGELAVDLSVKQWLAGLNRHLRRLEEGRAGAPQALLQEALFFLAASESSAPGVRALLAAHGLGAPLPQDFRQQRYGHLESVDREDALAQLPAIEAGWSRCLAGEPGAAEDVAHALETLMASVERLQVPALSQLLQAVAALIAAPGHQEDDEAVQLEIAASLLFIEQTLQHRGQLPELVAQHAQQQARRLAAAAAGTQPPEQEEDGHDFPRRLQQDQSKQALVTHLKATLRQAEGCLEDGFANTAPDRREALEQAAKLLQQMQGGVAILEEREAEQALSRLSADLAQLLSEGGTPAEAAGSAAVPSEPEILTKLTANIASLSFFLDQLALARGKGAGAYVFDPIQGVLQPQAALPETAPAPESWPLEEAEAELQAGAEEAAAEMRKEAEAEAEAGGRQADAAVPSEQPPAAEESAAAPLPSGWSADAEAEADAELLAIFLAEAEEMLACVAETLPLWRQQPRQRDHLGTIRRCFHTLKGSGRMVGLTALAEAAWEVEQALNQALADERQDWAALSAQVEQAWALLHSWVARLSQEASGQPQEEGGQALPEPDSAAADASEALLAEEGPEAGAVAFPDPGPQPSMEMVGQAAEHDFLQIGSLRVSPVLHAIFTAEARQLAAMLAGEVRTWQRAAHAPAEDAPGNPVGLLAVHAAHSLAGSSATVGCTALYALTHRLEQVLHGLARRPMRLCALELDTLGRVVSAIQHMLAQWEQLTLPMPALHALQALDALQAGLQRRGDALAPASDGPPAAPVAGLPEMPASQLPGQLPAVQAAVPLLAPPPGEVLAVPAEAVPLPDAASVPAGNRATAATPAAKALAPGVSVSASSADSALGQDGMPPPALQDTLDPDLAPVFLEEGNALLPEVEAGLRLWLQQPADATPASALLRHLHTLKGSARMAGAMLLGQQLHQLETGIGQASQQGQPSPAALEALLAECDASLQLFERLQSQFQPAQAAVAAAKPDLPQAPAPVAAASHLVRIRADLLENLSDQAAEVSIARARVEDRVAGLRHALQDMQENVDRLQHQLRELAIQAESRIAAHQQQYEHEPAFDPLEFDRFTRLQELTRMMAESANDIDTVQRQLLHTTTQAEGDLLLQGRLARTLQEDLLRLRMVQFGSITERLYRVCRQAAKELNKRVNLDIQGTEVEMDRQVLEKMAGPLEHLLRNAMVHGIESPAARQAAGKQATGQLTLRAWREGRQVVLRCTDDGQGLDWDRIRERARTLGLLEEAALADTEALQPLIFHPGFSTASSVSTLAGRGIGLDVVQAEALSLGGSIRLDSKPGQGTSFDIRLPLTLALSQVLLLGAAGRTCALPAAAIAHVLHLKAPALAAVWQQGAVSWQGQAVPLAYLPALMGEAAAPLQQASTPLVLVHAAEGLLALQVDQVLGQREVVLKPPGPHLARMAGIAGVTVLGSGEIVLILEPAQLNRLPEAEAAALAGAPAMPAEPSAAGMPLPAQPLVMVVDDSLTVRRVTQRLLEREGYQVVLAKDGLDALEQLQETRPDVLLLDIEMPRMDGFELARHLRSDARTRALPLIMITSRTAAKHRRAAEALGVNAYLGKPYQDSELLQHIARFLARPGSRTAPAVPADGDGPLAEAAGRQTVPFTA